MYWNVVFFFVSTIIFVCVAIKEDGHVAHIVAEGGEKRVVFYLVIHFGPREKESRKRGFTK